MTHKGCSNKSCAMAQIARSAGFDENDTLTYRKSCEFRTYDRGDRIYQQNTAANGIYCLYRGYVMLWHTDEVGHDIGFRVVGLEDLFGHRAYFGEDPHKATAIALTNCTVCYHHKNCLGPLLEKYPSLSKQFLRMMALDRGPPDSLLLRNSYLSVKTRLINLLLILKRDFAKQHINGKLVFELPLYRKDISTMVAARQETVARAISELQQDNLAHFNRRTVVVPDLERLKIAAQNGGDA